MLISVMRLGYHFCYDQLKLKPKYRLNLKFLICIYDENMLMSMKVTKPLVAFLMDFDFG